MIPSAFSLQRRVIDVARSRHSSPGSVWNTRCQPAGPAPVERVLIMADRDRLDVDDFLLAASERTKAVASILETRALDALFRLRATCPQRTASARQRALAVPGQTPRPPIAQWLVPRYTKYAPGGRRPSFRFKPRPVDEGWTWMAFLASTTSSIAHPFILAQLLKARRYTTVAKLSGLGTATKGRPFPPPPP